MFSVIFDAPLARKKNLGIKQQDLTDVKIRLVSIICPGLETAKIMRYIRYNSFWNTEWFGERAGNHN